MVAVSAFWGPSSTTTTEKNPQAWSFTAAPLFSNKLEQREITATNYGEWQGQGAWKPMIEGPSHVPESVPASILDWIDDATPQGDLECFLRSASFMQWGGAPIWTSVVHDRRSGNTSVAYWNGTNGDRIPNNQLPGITFHEAREIFKEAHPEWDSYYGDQVLLRARAREDLYLADGFLDRLTSSTPSPADSLQRDGRAHAWTFDLGKSSGLPTNSHHVMSDGRVIKQDRSGTILELNCDYGGCDFMYENPVLGPTIDSTEALALAEAKFSHHAGSFVYMLADEPPIWTIKPFPVGESVFIPARGDV